MRRCFVTLPGGRQVHYRRHGAGPPLVLLHESPETSRQYEPLMCELGDRLTCFALDAPGRGLSDPLPGLTLETASIARYAAATAEALEALDLGPVPVLGTHTGAMITVELGCTRPDLVSLAVVDALPVIERGLARELGERYAPPIGLEADGSHLERAWQRVLDASFWFPWYARDEEHRRSHDVTPAGVVHERLMNVLHSGEGYCLPFAAAFRFEAARRLRDIAAPHVLLCRSGDVQERAQSDLPPGFRTAVLPTDVWRERVVREVLARSVAAGPRATVPTAPAPGRVTRAFAGEPPGQVLVRRFGQGSGSPLVVLPGAPGGGRGWDAVVASCAADRDVIVLDLPGAGASDAPGEPGATTPASVAAAVAAALAELGVVAAEITGTGVGVVVAAELATRRPDLVRRVVPAPAAPPSVRWYVAPEALDLAPSLEGTHIREAWRAALRAHGGMVPDDLPAVHELAVDLLLAGQCYQLVEDRLSRSGSAAVTPA